MTEPAPLQMFPCEPWTTAEDALACCEDLTDSDLVRLTYFVEEASQLLYELSGQRYSGLCERTVRPCSKICNCFQVLSRGYVIRWDNGAWCGMGGEKCGCTTLPRIALTGYPVREITEVLIDGDVVAAADYRLDRNRYLVRLNGERWPSCQRMELDEGPGTMFVSYLYGLEAPLAGIQAANQLACELARSCSEGDIGECKTPANATRITRQGVTIDIQVLGAFLASGQTGLAQVDAFLGTYRMTPRRPAALYTPELDPFPLPVGG